jgi:hypothetical protein
MLVNAAGAAKEALDPAWGGQMDLKDVGMNAAGSTFAIPVLKIGF